ncbi:hypothetical protein ACFJGX_01450 [Hydrogenophaga sp. UC242_50]|uniref:hypothetical protein n=1 Tax=unclassified Hydrogenophaga TaxID=2610897 RepID=UPI0036D3BF0E
MLTRPSGLRADRTRCALLVVRPLIKEHAAAHYNVLTFEISGHIHMQPYPLEFMVQSNVDLETNRIELHPTRSPTP